MLDAREEGERESTRRRWRLERTRERDWGGEEKRHVNPNMSVTSIALRQTANCFRTKALGANFEKQFAGTDG
ncbi:hypothetical protein ALC56_03860 [Trachymyrmex septentrionalis]|uniref:Uncharacterized protein n=1 Tax=Trachymyrmex septentrionalis TaxID=34720 RepID=A0A195FN30_9HYME|nr:hypothetical protein ALC56_03860 [Trachymyrmex septentrionalis]